MFAFISKHGGACAARQSDCHGCGLRGKRTQNQLKFKEDFPKTSLFSLSLNSLVSRCLNLIFTVLPWHRSMELYCRCCCFHFTSISVPSGDDGVVTTHTHMHRDPTNGLFSPI